MEEIKYFFSYSRKDSEFVLRLAKDLRAVGTNLWLDQLDILGGQRWDRVVEKALKTCQGMIAVLSPESLTSNNVMDEISYALEERKLIVPILLRSCEIPFRLRRVQYIDFTADYDTGFYQLLKALRIDKSTHSLKDVVPEEAVVRDVTASCEEMPVETLNIEQLPITTGPHEPEKHVAKEDEESWAETSTGIERKQAEAQITRCPDAQLSQVDARRKQTRRERTTGAVVWGIVGALLMLLLAKGVWYARLGVGGIVGAITGTISGRDRRVISAAIVGYAIAALSLSIIFTVIGNVFDEISDVTGGILIAWIFGGPIWGAIVGVMIKKWKG